MPIRFLVSAEVYVEADWLTRDEYEQNMKDDPDTLIELCAEEIADAFMNPRNAIDGYHWVDGLTGDESEEADLF